MSTLTIYALLCLIWGSTWLAIRIGLADMPPFWSLSIRLIPALLFLIAVAAYRGTPMAPLRREKWRVLQIGLLTYPGAYCLVYWGEQYITSGLAAVMFSTMPFFVALFAWWLLPAERLGPRAAMGLVLGFGGLMTIYWEQINLGSTEKVFGMLAVTLSALIAAFNTVTIRRWMADMPAVALSTATVALGGRIVPCVARGGPAPAPEHLTLRAVTAATYLGIAGSGLAFVLYYQLLSRVPALTMSLITFVTPLIALTLGVFFDYEPFGWRTWTGIGLVLAGVLLAALGSTGREQLQHGD